MCTARCARALLLATVLVSPCAGWHSSTPVVRAAGRLPSLSGPHPSQPSARPRPTPLRAARAPARQAVGAAVEGERAAGAIEPIRSAAAAAAAEAKRSLDGSELSWETAVARFGLLPKALRQARRREQLLGSRLRGLPGFLFLQRTSQIWVFLSAFVIKRALANSTRRGTAAGAAATDADAANERQLARECKEGLIALGPTFIKLGQLLSTRVDVMPPAFIEELSTLQDECPPFPLAEVLAIVDRELGPGAFAQFDDTPLAAASLGQVHLATTRDGRRVAVKVQRPGLEDLFKVDLKNLQVLSEVAMSLDRTPDRVLRDWREIFEQNAKIIYEEIDYRREARNAQAFADNFRDIPWLRTPRVFPELSSARILTMEYCPGVKVNDVRAIEALGLDRAQLATYAAEAYLLQLLRFGFFHCDPHPGNVAVERVPDDELRAAGRSAGAAEGRIILYDYGMMGTLSPQLKGGLVRGFFAVYEGDAAELAQALFDAELLGADTDRLSVEMISRYFIKSFSARFAMDKQSMPADRDTRERMRVEAMQQIGQELAAIGGSKPFRYPEAFPFILRAFTALEGIGKTLDPQYDVYRIARRYLAELADLKDGSAALTAVKSVQKKLGLTPEDLAGLVTFPRKITALKKLADRVENGEVKLRVRALEVERALFRAALLQRATLYGVFACLLLNSALVGFVALGRAFWLLQLLCAGAAFCAVRAALCLLKLKQVLRDEANRYYNSYIG